MTGDPFSLPGDDPPPPPQPLPTFGGPLDGLALLPGPHRHTWLLNAVRSPDPPATPSPEVPHGAHRWLRGDAAFREHWAYELAFRMPRPDAADVFREVAGVYDAAGGTTLVWCALHPACTDPDRPAGRWRLRALLTWWEALCLHETYHLVGGLPDILAVRDAWRGVRGVEHRAWALAKTLYFNR